jgi:ABC-type transport system involved in multi-copper enzyme maturation permease subunit
MPQTIPPIIRIARYTLTDEVRQKSFIVMFVICALFIFLVRGCYQGNFMVNGQALDADAVIRMVSKLIFHVIAVGAMLLTALLSMRVFRRDRDDGMQSSILSKPIARWQYVAGKILGLWALSVSFMFVLHSIVFIIASINLEILLPEYLLASLLCSFNLLFVVVAVLLLSLLMSDVFAFLCVLGIGIVGVMTDGIYALSHSPMAQAMIGQAGTQSDWTAWKVVYFSWPKLSGAERFASSFIGSEGLGSIYPLLNILAYVLILGTLLFWRFRNEDII